MADLVEVGKTPPVRQKRSRSQANKGVPESSRTTLAVLGGHGNPECWYRDSQSHQLEKLTTIPGKCSSWLSVCAVPGGFVVTGGNGVTCALFLSATKAWEQLKSLLAPRSQHASISINRKIFVLGGWVSGSTPASVHSLELDGGEWKEEADLPDPVRYPAVARVSNNTFLMDMENNTFFHQDGKRKMWIRKAKCPGSTCIGARMTAARGQLLVAGRCFGNMFHCYNPATNTWTTGKAPALRHNFGALLFHEEKLFLIGGEYEDRVEEYDFTTESWSVCAFRVPRKLYNLYAVALDM